MNYKDDAHWSNLTPPLSPSEADVLIYKHWRHVGSTLLLGHTKELLHLADVAVDLNPIGNEPKVMQGDWTMNGMMFTNIICDGGLTLSKDLCDRTLTMASKNCMIFISRVFHGKLPGMKYATHFPTDIDFTIKPSVSMILSDYTFFRWDFDAE